MRIRTTVAAFVLAGAATLSLSGTALAQQTDRDCPDFSTQAEAQAALDSRAGDPERLDRDKDGIACEDRFGVPAGNDDNNDDNDEGQVRTRPRGGVETGDGTTDEGGLGGILLVLTGIGAGGAAVATARRRAAAHSG
jgi:hypothetical protein